MSGTTNTSETLNQASAHDTGLYDPNIHDNQIVALYDTDAQARAAKDTLVQAGFPAARMEVLARDPGNTVEPAADEGFWGAIKGLFVPDEERNTFNHAIARGHAMLVVNPDSTMDRQHLIHTLEATAPLDFDAKLEEWRQTGYDTTGHGTAATPSNTATAGHAVDTGLNTARAPSPDTVPATPAMRVADTAATTPRPAADGAPDTIKRVEESLRVGKREVSGGAVRVRSYIVERPVEESIKLHEEHISVERRPVDRPASAADFNAFQERTIEARATSEEAVVSKEARVVEEIALKKEASDRTETVHDTVRKTEVEIDGDAATRTGTLPGSTNANPNATPDAGTSGTNSPRK